MEKIIAFYKSHKKSIAIGVLGFLAIALPVVVSQVLNQQDVRQRASTTSGVTLKLNPSTQNVNLGNQFTVDLIMDTGIYDVSAVDISLNYDSSKLHLISGTRGSSFNSTVSFSGVASGTHHNAIYNTTANPIKGSPITVMTYVFSTIGAGQAAVSVNGPELKIAASGVAGNVSLTSTSQLTGNYTILEGDCPATGKREGCSCETDSQCASAICKERLGESTKVCLPATSGSPTLTPTSGVSPAVTITPTVTPTVTPTTPPCRDNGAACPTLTPTRDVTPTVTPVTTPIPGANVSLNLKFPGIGTGTSDNNTVKHPTRTAVVALFSSSGQLVKTATGNVSYANGLYKGVIPMGDVTPDSYEVKVKLDNTLWRKIPKILIISSGTQELTTPTADLISGDISGTTNLIDLSDYNSILACYAGTCATNIKTLADLNDDEKVDAKDLNILLRAFASRQGD